MNITYILIGAVVLLVFYGVMTYNLLVQLRNRIKEAFAGIDVQLKRDVYKRQGPASTYMLGVSGLRTL